MSLVANSLKSLVKRSESLFKVDMIYVTRGGFWTTLRFGVGIVASIATMLAFGNLVSKETYGTYNYLLSLAGTFGFLTLAGMGTGVIRAVARGYESVVPYALRAQLKYNLLAVAGVGAAAIYYGIKGNSSFSLSLGILALATPLAAAFHVYEAVLIGKKKFDTLTVITAFTSLGAAGATVITLFLTQNVVILVAVYGAMALLPNILAYRYIQKSLPVEEPSAEAISELKRTAFHLTGAGVISALAQYIDKIILFQVAGPIQLAVYGFATAGPERLKGLAKNWVSVALPRLAERSLSDIRKMFYRRIAFSLAIGVGLAGLYVIFSPLLFKFLLPQYLDAILYSQIYALGLILVPASVFIGFIFYGQNMLRAVYLNSLSSQITRIALFTILGWRYEIWGLIAAYLISLALSLLYSVIIWELEARRLSKNG